MNRQDLQKNGIHIEENPGALPSHIGRLRSTLLDFRAAAPERLQIQAEGGIQTVTDRFLEWHRETGGGFKRLYAGDDREAEWQDYYREKFFDALANEMNVRDDDSRR